MGNTTHVGDSYAVATNTPAPASASATGGGLPPSTTVNVNGPLGGVSTAVFTMAGIAATYTPTVSTKVLIRVVANAYNTTPADGFNTLSVYGTGAPPANGAVAQGTAFVGIARNAVGVAASTNPFTLVNEGIVTGLIVGQPIWFDIQLKAVTGGAATLAGITVTFQEVA